MLTFKKFRKVCKKNSDHFFMAWYTSVLLWCFTHYRLNRTNMTLNRDKESLCKTLVWLLQLIVGPMQRDKVEQEWHLEKVFDMFFLTLFNNHSFIIVMIADAVGPTSCARSHISKPIDDMDFTCRPTYGSLELFEGIFLPTTPFYRHITLWYLCKT